MSGKVEKKKPRKAITLETKLNILRRFEAGERPVNIAKALGLAESTVKTIRDRDGSKIKEIAAAASVSDAKKITRARDFLLVKMESLLSIWIEKQNHDQVPLTKSIIQEKAKKLYEDIEKKSCSNNLEHGIADERQPKFLASQGWFERFKARYNLHNVKLKGEAASADSVAAAKFPDVLKAIIHSEGLTSQQVFNVDETGLFWKRLPSRTYISKAENSVPGRKPIKNRLTLLLGGNAEGDFKFKPFLIHTAENPRAMKGVNKKNLPVHWRSNKKAWMTSEMFKNWICECAIPEIKSYCSKENLDFKALIIVDNAPSHPIYIDDLSDNLKFLFMPPNTTSLIQPMDQGVISVFKSYYLRRTFKQLIIAIDDSEKNSTTIPEFWKTFNVLDAINNISESWNEVTPSCMNGVWRKIWPECVHKNLDSSHIADLVDTSAVCTEIVNLAKENEFEGMDEDGVKEIITAQNEDISNSDLIDLDIELAYKENPTENLIETPEPKILTSKQISKAMALLDEAASIFIQNDPDEERSSKVARSLTDCVSSYKEIYLQQKKKTFQQTLEKYLQPLASTSTHPTTAASSDTESPITLDSDSS